MPRVQDVRDVKHVFWVVGFGSFGDLMSMERACTVLLQGMWRRYQYSYVRLICRPGEGLGDVGNTPELTNDLTREMRSAV